MNEEALIDGVRVIGLGNLPGRVAFHASQMFSSNIYNFIEHFWDRENKTLPLDPSDPIIEGCLITHDGRIVHKTIHSMIEEGNKE